MRKRLPDDDVGGEEEQDDRLDDVDDLGRDAGAWICISPAPRAHGAEQERRAAAMPNGFDRPSSATVMASKPMVVP